LIGHLVVSDRLDPHLFEFTIDRAVIRPLMNFGAGLVLSAIAAGLLVNLEKLVLARTATVEDLAHYSVAFTFASMTTMFTMAMTQSLLPAYSQLLSPESAGRLQSLFSRGVRINMFTLLPLLALLCVIARPFFTIWAGKEYGAESTIPFYVLSIGLFFNLNALVGGSLLYAAGRTDIIAKLFWAELVPYGLLVALLTSYFGPVGAAVAWSFRAAADGFIVNHLALRAQNLRFGFYELLPGLVGGMAILSAPLVFSNIAGSWSPWLLVFVPLSVVLYLTMVWKIILDRDEKHWVQQKIMSVRGRFWGLRGDLI
jgi:O-antigen/teichoic acid export membrane protein